MVLWSTVCSSWFAFQPFIAFYSRNDDDDDNNDDNAMRTFPSHHTPPTHTADQSIQPEDRPDRVVACIFHFKPPDTRSLSIYK